jgi:hypothetical protein
MNHPVVSQKSQDIGRIKRFFRHIGYAGKIKKTGTLLQFYYSRFGSYNKL